MIEATPAPISQELPILPERAWVLTCFRQVLRGQTVIVKAPGSIATASVPDAGGPCRSAGKEVRGRPSVP